MTSAERLKEYENLFKQSQSYNPAQFQQDFERSYGEATNYNKDLIESRNQAISQAQSLPAQLRQQYYSSPIRNPLAQEALISQQRGAITGDIANQSDLLDARGARYQDILGKQLGMYQTSAEQARTAAENAWRMYQDVLAQEEAEKARRAAAAAAASQSDIWDRLFGGGGGAPGGHGGGGDLDITVTPTKPRTNITNQAVKALQKTSNPLAGYDLTNFGNMSNRDKYLSAMSAINPLTQFKTIFGGIGNVVGNWNNKDMTLWQKLLNSR
jgi:uncharacterized protein YbjQ (UPF0145 family)